MKANPVEGFQLSFAFLKKSEVPEIMNYTFGLYNCSRMNYSVMRYLFGCNKIVDCSGGEDEDGCDYDTQGCPVGYFRTFDK